MFASPVVCESLAMVSVSAAHSGASDWNGIPSGAYSHARNSRTIKKSPEALASGLGDCCYLSTPAIQKSASAKARPCWRTLFRNSEAFLPLINEGAPTKCYRQRNETRHEPVSASNGRGYGPEKNGRNSGGVATIPADVSKMLSSGPSAAASALRMAGNDRRPFAGLAADSATFPLRSPFLPA